MPAADSTPARIKGTPARMIVRAGGVRDEVLGTFVRQRKCLQRAGGLRQQCHAERVQRKRGLPCSPHGQRLGQSSQAFRRQDERSGQRCRRRTPGEEEVRSKSFYSAPCAIRPCQSRRLTATRRTFLKIGTGRFWQECPERSACPSHDTRSSASRG